MSIQGASTIDGTGIGHGELLATLRGIGEGADPRALEIREQRRLPADIIEQLIDSGVFRTCVPTCYDGRGASAMEMVELIETTSYYEASVGWCVMVGGLTGVMSGFLSPEWAQEIYGDSRTVTGGLAAPIGRATVVEGGLRVSGRWGWGSGTTHCNWICGGVSIRSDDESQATRPDGLKTPLVFFPASEVKLHDNWHTLGLAGTGSVDYEVDDVFIPEGRWAPFPMRDPVVDEPLYHFTSIGLLATGVAFVSVGIARRAIDELIKLATAKVPTGSARPLSDRAVVQSRVVEAEAAWLSGRMVLREQLQACWDQAVGEGTISEENRRLLRVAAINATERCARAVDIAYNAGGGSAIHDESVLQRLFRDVHTATAHGANSPLFMERLGRMALGVSTETGIV